MNSSVPFGNIRESQALLWPAEQRLLAHVVPKIPRFLNGINLTLLSILWSIAIVIAYILSAKNIHWLWLANFCIILQYTTDILDGSVGRYRKSGLVRWGYYMDHFLDVIFLMCVIIGLGYISPSRNTLLIVVACGFLLLAFMVHSFLLARATDEFHISLSKVGATELRILMICVNILVLFVGVTVLNIISPIFFVLSSITLLILVLQTQRRLYIIDQTTEK